MKSPTIQLVFLSLAFLLAGCSSPGPGTFHGQPIATPPILDTENWNDITPAQLWSAVQDQVIAMEIERRGLKVSDAEIDRIIAMKTADSESVLAGASQYIHHQEAMERALKAWHDAPDEAESIYQKMLESEGVTMEFWETLKENYPDAEHMEKYWQTWDPEVAEKTRRENTRNQLLRIALASAIQGAPVEVPDKDWEALHKAFNEETGRELPMDSVKFEMKAGAAYDILRNWFNEILGSGELKLSDTYADRIRVWAPGMPTNGGYVSTATAGSTWVWAPGMPTNGG